MKRLLTALLVSAWAVSPAASDDMNTVVVELFTSQGCSSCPPADEMMHELVQRDDVIALSLHVDYWDYIGWKDEFADPRHAKRQRGYAMVAGRRSVYTPEMVVNGVSDVVGAKPMKLASAIERHKSDPRLVELSLQRSGDTVAITVKPLSSLQNAAGPLSVQMLRYQPKRVANITRGENAGRTISYVNVAQDWQYLQAWTGDAPLSFEAAAPGEWPVVVLVQAGEYGPILAASRLR